MKINVVSMWYNEEILAPLFLKHYEYANHIHIIVDADTTDNTVDIIKSFPNTSFSYYKPVDMLDDQIKVNLVKEVYDRQDCDWCLALDSDEFLFLDKNTSNISSLLETVPQEFNTVRMHLWDVYPHITDGPINYTQSIMEQRIHGELNRSGSYHKPNIVRGKQSIYWTPGFHSILGKVREYSNLEIMGTHWRNADEEFTVNRLIKYRKNRFSQNNLRSGFGVEYFNLTEKQIRDTFDAHRNDPILPFAV